MSYILSTAKASTSVLGAAFGNFLGTQGKTQLILNCVNRIEIWESATPDFSIADDPFVAAIADRTKTSLANLNSGPSDSTAQFSPNNGSQLGGGSFVPPPEFALLSEYRAFGTIKHMLAVPLPRDPRACSDSKVRLCLFLMLEKGDFSFLMMYRPASAPTTIKCVPLTSFNITNSLFKPHYNGTNLCTSSFEQFNNSVFSSMNYSMHEGDSADNDENSEKSADLKGQQLSYIRACSRPIIALSQYRSAIVLIDVAACLSTIPSVLHSARSSTFSKRKRKSGDEESTTGQFSSEEEASFVQQLVNLDEGQGAFTPQNCQPILDSVSFAPFTFCPVDEREPRSFSLYSSSKLQAPPNSPSAFLMVLYQDSRGRTHVRRYSVSQLVMRSPFWGVSAYERLSGDVENSSKGPNHAAQSFSLNSDEVSESLRSVVDKSILIKSKTRTLGMSLVRSILLQGDVESDAFLLHSMPSGLCVFGGALVTYIDIDGMNLSVTQSHPISTNSPSMVSTGINFVCTSITPNPFARSHPVSATTVSPMSCLVGYANGTVLAVTMADLGEAAISVPSLTTLEGGVVTASTASPRRRSTKKKQRGGRDSGELASRPNVLAEGFDVHCNVLNAYLSPMSAIAQIDKFHVLVASAVSHSVILRLVDGTAYTARENIGPIVDMCADSGTLNGNPPHYPYYKESRRVARPTVVAATGVDSCGSLTSISNAVHLTDRASTSGVDGVLEVYSVPSSNLVALSYIDGSQLLSLFEDKSTPNQLCLREVGQEIPEPTLAMGAIEGGLIVWVTHSSISLCVQRGESIETLHKEVFHGRSATKAVIGLSVAAVACNSVVHFFDLSSLNRVTSIDCGSAVACMSFVSDIHGTTDELLAGLWGSNTVALISPTSTITVIAALPSLPRSIICTALVPIERSLSVNRGLFSATSSDSVPPSNSHQRIFIGNSDGTVSHAFMPTKMPRSSVSSKLTFSTIAIGSQPVSMSSIQVQRNGVNVTVGVLCSGDSPAVLFDTGDSLNATGFGHAEFDCAAQLSEFGDSFVVYSRSGASLSLVSINPQGYEPLSKLSTLVRATIPKLKYISSWKSYAVVRFEENQDVVSLYSKGPSGALIPRTSHGCHPSSGSGFFPNTFKLLESERCMFVEWVQLNGKNFVVNADDETESPSYPAPHSTIHSHAAWDPAAPFGGLLIGTNFVFPNDVAPRNGRLILVALEHSEDVFHGKVRKHHSLVQLAEQDVRGMVLSACMMPGTNNKVLVGVTGAIRVMHWSPRDKNLTPLATISVGMACIKLTPLSGGQIGATKKQMEEHAKWQRSHVAENALHGSHAAEGRAGTRPSSTPPPCLVAVGDMKNSVTVLQFNDVEMARIETREVALREIMDFLPVGSCSFHSNGEFINPAKDSVDEGVEVVGGSASAYNPHFLVADADMNLVLLGNSLEPPQAAKKVPDAVQRHNAEEEADRQRREARVAMPSPGGSPLLTPSASRTPAFPPRTPATDSPIDEAPRNSVDGRGSGGSGAREAPPTFTGPSWTPSKLRSMDVVAQIHVGDRITTLVRGSLKISKGVTTLTENQRALLSEISTPLWTPPPQGLQSAMFAPLVTGCDSTPTLPASFLFGTAHGMIGTVAPLPSCVMKYLSLLEAAASHHNPNSLPCFTNENFRSTLSKDFHPNLYLNQTFNEMFDSAAASVVVERMKQKSKCRGFVDGDIIFDILKSSVNTQWKLLTLEEFNFSIQASYVNGDFDMYQFDAIPTASFGDTAAPNASRLVRHGVKLNEEGKIIESSGENASEGDILFSKKKVLAFIERERSRVERAKVVFGAHSPSSPLLLPQVDIDRLNSVLRLHCLPTLPFHLGSIEMFVGELQRTLL